MTHHSLWNIDASEREDMNQNAVQMIHRELMPIQLRKVLCLQNDTQIDFALPSSWTPLNMILWTPLVWQGIVAYGLYELFYVDVFLNSR